MQPQPDREPRLTLSLLDRLSDDDPESVHEGWLTSAQTRRKWEAGLLRDIDALLNSRRAYQEVSPEFKQTSESIIEFGLPDFTGMNLNSPADHAMLRVAIETALRRYEPRLASLSVVLEEQKTRLEPVLRFRVDALMRIETELEPIHFETILQGDSRRFSVMKQR
jgi:type VI secretion system protein ImpF